LRAKLDLRTRSVVPAGQHKELSQTDMTSLHQPLDRPLGSPDGQSTGDHDQPYRFGRQPRASAPYPFSTRQYARLLIFRSRLQDRPVEDGQTDAIRWPWAAA